MNNPPQNYSIAWSNGEQHMAGMGQPQSTSDIEYLKDTSVGLLVSLTEFSPSAEYFENQPLGQLHIPILDMKAPTTEQLDEFVKAAEESLFGKKENVAVHCRAGIGRTGTFLAA